MTPLDSLILGLVEGLTEFLPISSTGHLIITQKLLGLTPSVGLDAYLIVIQFGAIAAVVALYPHRIAQLFRGLAELFSQKKSPATALLLNLFIAFLPAAVIGLLLDHAIETYFFNTHAVANALLIGALIMIFAARRPPGKKSIDALTPRNALTIGAWQILSLWPGMSRSMTTIVSGQLCGLSARAAAEFSFLLGAIVLTAASGYKAVKNYHEIITLGVLPVLIGLVAAFLSAWVVVRFFVAILTRWGLVPWAVYRVLAAASLLFL